MQKSSKTPAKVPEVHQKFSKSQDHRSLFQKMKTLKPLVIKFSVLLLHVAAEKSENVEMLKC